uniref:GRIP domain-containing protein n=1 Tax=Denticeps clupeoides TaxID=299321 RepID=A0AAY4E2E7_9TELE
MDALLLEKAETHQNLVHLHKENEKTKRQLQDSLEELRKLHEKMEQAREEHLKKVNDLENNIEISQAKHREELERLQNIIKAKSETEQQEETQKQKEIGLLNANFEEVCQSYENKISSLQQELENAEKSGVTDMEALEDAHGKALLESQKDIEKLQEKISMINIEHEEHVKELTEQLELNAADFEMEKERLLLLQDELSEQLALKESYLQDVQEEEEDHHSLGAQSALVCRMLNDSEDQNEQLSQLRASLEDLQSQNTMLQEELTYLTNVKTTLESDLQHLRQEFHQEKEEMEFKINELQMTTDDTENQHITDEPDSANLETPVMNDHHKTELKDLEKQLLSNFEKENLMQEVQELRLRCEELCVERNSAVGEYEQVKEILRNLESELGEKTSDFIKQYGAMKEQSASAVQELQQKLRRTFNERDDLLEQIRNLERTVEQLEQEKQAVQELKTTSEVLSKKNEEATSRLHQKESEVQGLLEKLEVMSSEKHNLQQRVEQADAELAKAKDGYEAEKLEKNQLEDNLESLSKSSTELQHKVEGLSSDLEGALSEKERTRAQLTDLENRLGHVVAEREERSASLNALKEELAALQAEYQQSQDLLDQLRSEAVASCTKEQDDLQKRLQSIKDESDSVRKVKDAAENKIAEARSYIIKVLEQSNCALDADVDDIPGLLDVLVSKGQQERDDISRRCDKKVAELTDEVEMVKQQSSELQAHVEDLVREKSLLKGSLDEVMSDAEALQRDLSEMRAMNEKVRSENRELLTQIAEASEKLSAKEHDERSGENEKAMGEINSEKKELQQVLMEKERLVAQLKEDIALLQVCLKVCSVLVFLCIPFKKKLVLFSVCSAALEKEKKNKDEKMNKIKAMAVKAKKELDNSKKEVLQDPTLARSDRDRVSSSMKDIIHGAEDYKNLMMDYDKQTEELDKQRERLERAEQQIGDLTKRLQMALQQHEELRSEREDLTARMETLQTNARQLEAQALEMHKVKCSLERDLEGERLLKDQKIKDHLSAVKEVEDLQLQLQRQKVQLQQTAQELEQLRKDAQQNTLLDMEMADYERLVKDLNSKISEKDVRIEDLEAQIQTQKKKEERLSEEIGALKSQVDQGEEKFSKMKQLLVKTKKELADAKKNATAQMVAQAALKGELEAHQQQLEDLKIQCSELTAERHRLQERVKQVTEQQQRVASSFQHRLTASQEECNTAKTELAATTSEFESYKVRVHNVLKQQKSKTSSLNDSDVGRQEREHLETVVEQLRIRLQDTQQSLQATSTELQQLQTEHDTLLERHNKILQENVAKEAELRERLLSLQSENVALKSEHTQSVSQLTLQADTMRSSFREQLRHLQDEHRGTVETLQEQISRLENQLFQLQKEPSVLNSASVQQGKKPLQDRKLADLPLFDLQSMAREEGEGMETTETESVSSAGTPLPSLEQLLTSPDPKREPFVWQVEPTKDELNQKLSTANRSLEHVSGLLHETEATNAILMEQIALLKKEVRRLERNQEREKSVANLEYLKNVLLQFIFLRSGSERQALLPVIHTMLQLSPEEKSKLAAIAQGEEEVAVSRGSGWTSYLHSWSGIR